MRNVFLFDLDGTLLPMDFKNFMELYFKSIGNYFKDTIHPLELMNNINTATKHTVLTNDGRTNEDIFMEFFDALVEAPVSEYLPRFYNFYDSDFIACKESTWQDDSMVQAVRLLKDKGYRVAIATNPLLPLRSNLHRIRWAGFDPEEFEYISSFEGNKYCKPHLSFYEEVLKNINVSPEACYMVGNDVSEDMVAKNLGIETYLITDCLLNHRGEQVEADHVGTYVNFLDFVKNLPHVK